MRKDWRVVVVGAALAGALCAPSVANAGVTVSDLTVVPTTTAAGAHPDVTITEKFSYTNSTDSIKTTVLHFPPGLIGNPQATAKCTEAQFTADTCPANTSLGTVSVDATALPPISMTITSPGTIYNLVPDAAHPAVLGIVVRPSGGDKIFLKSPVSLRTSTDFGIESPVDNQPNTATIGPLTAPIQITGTTLTLFGNPPGGVAPFMTNPTSCKPATTNLDALSYETPSSTATKASTFTPIDCDKLAFAPHLTATMGAPGSTAKGSRPPFQATITQAVGDASQLSATVTLPSSLASATNSVSTLCTADQLAAAACPDGARIGTATISSPLLTLPVQGPVFALLRPAQLPGVGVEFGGVLPFVLGGSAALTPTGRLQNVFTGLPDVPLTSFALAIDGGPHGLLQAGSDLCSGSPTVDGAFTGQNGASVTATAPVTVVGCGPRASKPSVKASLRGLAGNHPRLRVTVLKGANPMRSLSISLPRTLKVKKVRGGVTAVGSRFRLGKRSMRLTRSGVLRLRLPDAGARRVTATLSKGSFVAKKSLRRKLREHRTVNVRLVIRTVDSALKRSTVRKTVKGRR